jgi:hypothetical protein
MHLAKNKAGLRMALTGVALPAGFGSLGKRFSLPWTSQFWIADFGLWIGMDDEFSLASLEKAPEKH